MSKGFEVGHKVLIWKTLLNSNEVSHKRSQLSFVVLAALCKNAVSGIVTECIKIRYKELSLPIHILQVSFTLATTSSMLTPACVLSKTHKVWLWITEMQDNQMWQDVTEKFTENSGNLQWMYLFTFPSHEEQDSFSRKTSMVWQNWMINRPGRVNIMSSISTWKIRLSWSTHRSLLQLFATVAQGKGNPCRSGSTQIPGYPAWCLWADIGDLWYYGKKISSRTLV